MSSWIPIQCRALCAWWLFILQGVIAIFPDALQPGPALAAEDSDFSSYSLRNGVLDASISFKDGVLQPLRLVNLISGQRLPDAHSLQIETGRAWISSNEFQVLDVKLVRLEPQEEASQLSLRESGWGISVSLLKNDVEAQWSLELRDHSNVLKLTVRMWRASDQALAAMELKQLCLLSGMLKGGYVAGRVEGVPVVSEDFFLGVEHPQGINSITKEFYKCCLKVKKAITAQTWQSSLAVGIVVPGQLRRSFLHYLERQRAHPSRGMLHYNTWYDIGTGQQFSAAEAEARLQHISKELGRRGVVLDAFLLDDGWDDPDQGPWQPHAGFSVTGLTHLEKTAKGLKTALGVWFSPFGGYHEPRQRRINAARRVGIPVREEVRERIPAKLRTEECSEVSPCGEGEGRCRGNNDCQDSLECWHTRSQVSPPGIDLSQVQDPLVDICFDPGVRSAYLGLGIEEYFAHFEAVLLKWIAGGAKLLKLDGIGNPSGMSETLQEDFDSAVALIATIRKQRNDIFINLSTGTWPSPFWLLHSDTVWRRGHDHYFAGPEGPPRERWITYRDAMVYQNVVLESPLFPLNSLMIHGIIFAQDAWDLSTASGFAPSTGALDSADKSASREHFKNEVRSAFGSGAMLQELYITPALLQTENWDDLAEAASWASSCVGTMTDVQWFGGDPAQGAIYGWAAWSIERAILTLRNPAPTPKNVQLELMDVFGLPSHAVTEFKLNTPFQDQRPRQIRLTKGRQIIWEMPPYAVYVFDSGARPPSAYAEYMDILWNGSPAVFWTSVLVAAAWRFWGYGRATSSSVPVPIEELRRRRLQALESS